MVDIFFGIITGVHYSLVNISIETTSDKLFNKNNPGIHDVFHIKFFSGKIIMGYKST